MRLMPPSTIYMLRFSSSCSLVLASSPSIPPLPFSPRVLPLHDIIRLLLCYVARLHETNRRLTQTAKRGCRHRCGTNSRDIHRRHTHT
ncbi:hypothetical protein GGR51DRAFT_357008 [Nemania sp. FL0031]|nr:hypothetical protein GGR51DRAFT_357008 [Nemania sp. FL0031]